MTDKGPEADSPLPGEWRSAAFTTPEPTDDPQPTDDPRRAPLTWGQRALAAAIRRRGPDQVMFSLRRTVTVTRRAPADVETVLLAIGALIGRHSSLRTRLDLVGDEPGQLVAARGEQPVLLVHADSGQDSAEVAETVADRLAAAPFAHADEWPQRVALVSDDERVRQIVVVFSHTTVDFRAADLVLRDLRLLLLRGAIDHPAGLQSADIGDREQTDLLRRRSARACAYWVAGFGRLPADTLPRLGPPLAPRFRRAVLTSAAADVAVGLIARRHQVTSSTVLLAATAVTVASWSDTELVGIHTMVNNRSRPGYGDAIAKLNQIGLVVVDLTGRPTFSALLARTWQAALDGYRHAYYDPTELGRAFTAAGLPFEAGVNPHCYLNDIRLSTDTDLIGRPTGPDDLRAAQRESRFAWAQRLDRFTWRMRVEIVDRPRALGLALTADTGYLPPDAMRRFVLDLESLLVEAAWSDPAVPPPAPTRPARSSGGWPDPRLPRPGGGRGGHDGDQVVEAVQPTASALEFDLDPVLQLDRVHQAQQAE
nr:condensation domain-containing protein [Micromonospora sp. DSM 115978]